MQVARTEKIEIEKNSAALIATLAEGSFRDALSILQKAVHSSSDKNISHEDVERVLGAPSESLAVEVLESIANKDPKIGLEAISKVSEQNADMQVFLALILRLMRFILLLRFAKDMRENIESEVGEETYNILVELAKSAKNINSKTLLTFLEASSRQNYSSIPELAIELAVIESCQEID